MARRVWVSTAFVVLLSTVAHAGPVLAQQSQDTTATGADSSTVGDSIELVFEREVFSYPVFQRRNPFRPLTGDEASGPRFEDLVYFGGILGSGASGSVALVGARVAGAGTQQPAARTYRLRVNDMIGNVRVLEIRREEMIVEVEDFGVRETRVLPRSVTVTPPPVAPSDRIEPEDDEPQDDPPADADLDGSVDDVGLADDLGLTDNDTGNDRALGPILDDLAENGNGGWS